MRTINANTATDASGAAAVVAAIWAGLTAWRVVDVVPLRLVAWDDKIQDLLRGEAAEIGFRDANGALRLAVFDVENAVAGVGHKDSTTSTTTRKVLVSTRHRDGAMLVADRDRNIRVIGT